MGKLAYFAIILIALTVSGLLFVASVKAETIVNGSITTDTTWTRANSPYTLTSDVAVSNGVTLTIEPGVTVNLGSHQLWVYGILNARSTTDRIVFSGNSGLITFSSEIGWNEQTSYGCIIDNAYFSSIAMVINGGYPKISNNYFTVAPRTAIEIYGGSPSIINNVINIDSKGAIDAYYGSSPVISYNSIVGKGQQYGITASGTAYISNNNVTKCWTGIHATGASTIQNNIAMNNGNDGIRSDNSASIIESNVLANNKCGMSGTGTIRYNTIANNLDAGIWGPLASATITQNNIYGNGQNIHLTEHDNITAANNWWGTADVNAINQTIWDRKNDPINLGTLDFIPYLSEPNSNAPSIPDAITVQPTPTLPTITPTPTSTPTTTPTPIIIIIEPSNNPTQGINTQTPIETQPPILGQFNFLDIFSVAVIALAIVVSIAIIVFINKKYGKD